MGFTKDGRHGESVDRNASVRSDVLQSELPRAFQQSKQKCGAASSKYDRGMEWKDSVTEDCQCVGQPAKSNLL